jgi:hypothetical protein
MEYNIKMGFKEMCSEGVHWIEVLSIGTNVRLLWTLWNELLSSVKDGEFADKLSESQFLKNSAPRS